MFITFEGIDFCGKSTQVLLLKKYLEAKGQSVKIIREPGGTVMGEQIRDILLDNKYTEMSSESEIFLFSAARAQLVRQVILPALALDVYVISDRFFDSTTAYQGYGRGLSLESVDAINRLAVGNALPDVTFLIDIPVDVMEDRKKQNLLIQLDRIELSQLQFYENVRNGYLKIAEKAPRFCVLDGTAPVEALHASIIRKITELQKGSSV